MNNQCYLDVHWERIQYTNENWKLIPIPVDKETVENVESKYIKMYIKEWVQRVLRSKINIIKYEYFLNIR